MSGTGRLEEELRACADSELYPFHMPGHKRQAAEGGPSSPYRMDFTEIDGLDNLHAPEGLLLEEMQLAARLFGSRETFFLVNGSTCGILTAISAAVPRGGTLLLERSCHISVYHAACLRSLQLVYLEEGGLETERFDAVVITSPSYEGYVKDVGALAERVHARGALLIVDEAHGAHLSRHPYFPGSAVGRGADLVVQSMHKTLPALTQTALLHNVTGAVSSRKLQGFLDMYETSSPSYLLLSSMTACLHRMAELGSGYFEPYVRRLKALRRTLSALSHLTVAGSREEIGAGRYDPGKLLVITGRGNWFYEGEPMTGPRLYALLRTVYLLQPEMKRPDAVLLMTSPADTEEGFARLEAALLAVDGGMYPAPRTGREQGAPAGFAEPSRRQGAAAGQEMEEGQRLPASAMTVAEAWEAPREWIPLPEAEGRISAGFINLFPPDCPVLVPGERFGRAETERIRRSMEENLTVTGLRRGPDGCLLVSVII